MSLINLVPYTNYTDDHISERNNNSHQSENFGDNK